MKIIKFTEKRIRNQDFGLVSLAKEFMTDLRRGNKRQVEMKDSNSSIVSRKEFYKGEEVEVQSRVIQGDILQERFFFTDRNGTRIAKHIVRCVDGKKFEPKAIKASTIRNSLDLGSHFLTCISSEPMKEIIAYDFGKKERKNIQRQKINRIIDWIEVEDNPQFNSNFVYKMQTLLSRGELTETQETSLDNIIEKWRI